MIRASDGEIDIEIGIKVSHEGNSLTREENAKVLKELYRKIATDVLPTLPYSDFGAENIKIS